MIIRTSFAVMLSIVASVSWLTQCPMFHSSHRVKSHKSHNTAHVSNHRPDATNVISADQTGTLVSADWMHRYNKLETIYQTIPEDKTIYMEGDNYRIPIKVADHFNKMVRGGP